MFRIIGLGLLLGLEPQDLGLDVGLGVGYGLHHGVRVVLGSQG